MLRQKLIVNTQLLHLVVFLSSYFSHDAQSQEPKTLFQVFLFPFLYRCVYGCVFCMLLFNFVSCVFLLLCLCILTVMYALFCIFYFHRANWHSSATLTVVFPCFFLICKENARVYLAKTGHGQYSSQSGC
jgi:hypothetical protein